MVTYVNDLRLSELATGEGSGTWGTTTNTNLELIGEALGYATEGITTNADTHATTVADGSTDPGRAMYIKYTGTLDSACTITIGPNTMTRVHLIENATSGSQNIIIKQGSGAEVTIPNGFVKAVYLDGAGSGAAVTEAFTDLSVGGNLLIDGTTPKLTIGDGGAEDTAIVFDGNAQDFYIGLDDSADDLIIGLGSTVGTTPIISVDENKDVAIPDGALTITTDDNTTQLTLTSTDADASTGPKLDLVRDSASPADDDVLGKIRFLGDNDAGGQLTYADIEARIVDASNGSEDGRIELSTALAGSGSVSRIFMDATETIINNDSKDLDFRIESDGDTHRFFVDGGHDRILIGTTASRTMSGVTPNFFIEGLDYADSGLGAVINANGVNDCPLLLFGKSRGTSLGSNTIVQNGDRLFTMRIDGSDGTNLEQAAMIEVHVDAAPANNSVPGRLSFWTTNDGAQYSTENMRINSAGNVGIGDTVPAWGSAYRALTIGSSGAIWTSRTGTSLTALADNTYFNGSNQIARNTQAGAQYTMSAGSHVWENAPSVSAGANQTFSTKMMINAAGSVLIGKSTDDVDTDGAVIIGAGVYYASSNSGTYNNYHYRDTSSNSYKFYVSGSGQVNSTFTSIAQISDARLKENVRDYETGGLAEILKLQPRVFDWKENEGKNIKNDVGFIAQEFEEVFPDWVSNFLHDDLEDAKTVSASEIIYPMVNAIKTLSAEIELLKTEVAALKGA